MKKIAAVCVITNAYIPSARVVFESLHRLYPDMPLYVFMADIHDERDAFAEYMHVISLEDISFPGIPGMIERYNDFQLCCALKPFAIEEVLKREGEISGVMYCDTDLFFISPLLELEAAIDRGYDVIVTPHFFDLTGKKRPLDFELIKYGIFNMGFCFFSASEGSRRILEWWRSRLEYYCYLNPQEGLCDDQKWLDLLPLFSDNYLILQHKGYNVAYWNIDDRPVRRTLNNEWLADDVPLRFLHFSHFHMATNPLFSTTVELYNSHALYDLPELVQEYADRLQRAGWSEYRGRPNSLRSKLLQQKAEDRLPRCDPEKKLSTKSLLACCVILFPLALVYHIMEAGNYLKGRTCTHLRAFSSNPMGRIKVWGKAFFNPVWSNRELYYRQLQYEGGWRKKFFSPCLLLTTHMRGISGGIRGLGKAIRRGELKMC